MSDLAVFDTNVFVSHFLTPKKESAVNAAVGRIFERKAIPVYSDAIMAEYAKVLTRPKFRFSENRVCSFLKLIRVTGYRVSPTPTGVPFTDASDKCFYEAALSSLSWLVAGNKRHYPQESFIVSPHEYIDRVGL